MNFKRMNWLKIIGLSFAAFILAFFLPLPLFILSIAGIFYFSKKKPDKTLRNLSIALAVLSFIGVGMNDTNTPESTEKEAEIAVVEESEEEKSAESESLEKAKQKELEEKEAAEKEAKEKEESLIAQKEAEKKALEEKESKEAEEEKTRQMLVETLENEMIISFIDTFNTDVPGMVLKQDESDPKILYVHIVDEKLSTEVSLAIVNERYRESFNGLLDSLATLSGTVEETIGDGYAFMLLNPVNEENTIAIVMSGLVVYNAFDDLD